MRSIRYKDRTFQDRIFDFIIVFLAWSAIVVVGYPLIYIVSCSMSDPMAIYTGRVWLWPVEPTFRAYSAIVRDIRILRGFGNSLVLVAVGTVMTVFVTLLGAYPLYRREFVGKKLVMVLLTITMFFGGGMIPTYVVIRNLGFINKIWALTVPGAMSVWSIIVARTFFQQNIPEELREATMLDGGSDFSFLFRVVIPLSKAVIAVLALMYAVGRWNGYFDAMIYLSSSKKYPLAILLREILILNQVDINKISQIDPRDIAARQSTAELLKYALIVVSSLPVMMLYPFAQKYFVKGVVVGSLKG